MDDLISRQAALRTDCFGDGHDGLRAFHMYEDYLKMRKYLESLPSAQPSLKDAVTVIRGFFSKGKFNYTSEFETEDGETLHTDWGYFEDGLDEIERYIESRDDVPSAQPERKKVKWLYGEDEYGIDGYSCEKCGFFVPWDYVHKFINYIEDYHYCPNCGADMKEETSE